jgi:hypothetical protein
VVRPGAAKAPSVAEWGIQLALSSLAATTREGRRSYLSGPGDGDGPEWGSRLDGPFLGRRVNFFPTAQYTKQLAGKPRKLDPQTRQRSRVQCTHVLSCPVPIVDETVTCNGNVQASDPRSEEVRGARLCICKDQTEIHFIGARSCTQIFRNMIKMDII